MNRYFKNLNVRKLLVTGKVSRHFSSHVPHGTTKPRVSYLDLQNSGLSALERLCLEEALLRHDPLKRSWAIVGTHEPAYHTYLKNENSAEPRNDSCVVIMGIGGKPRQLLDVEKVKEDNVLTIKRFSGGGTVVVDHSSLWTTFIGRNEHFPHVEPYPRSIMQWSAEEVFIKVFERMKSDAQHNALMAGSKKSLVLDTASCGMAQDSGKTLTFVSKESRLLENNCDLPSFSLRENDYVLGERKVGGNAQSIVNGAWLHHTSFLWDYEEENMAYLTIPEKKPKYRGDRNHDDFLVKLKSAYGSIGDDHSSKRAFFYHVKCAVFETFEMEEVLLKDAMKVIDELGGMQTWFESKCRTKIMDLSNH
jgi:lipoate-protein ligase A